VTLLLAEVGASAEATNSFQCKCIKNLPSEQGVKMIWKHKHNLLLGPITARRLKPLGFEVTICFLPSHFTNTERKAHGVSLVWLSESTNVVHGKLKCQITRAILLPQSHACWLLTKCVPESRKSARAFGRHQAACADERTGFTRECQVVCCFEYYSSLYLLDLFYCLYRILMKTSLGKTKDASKTHKM